MQDRASGPVRNRTGSKSIYILHAVTQGATWLITLPKGTSYLFAQSTLDGWLIMSSPRYTTTEPKVQTDFLVIFLPKPGQMGMVFSFEESFNFANRSAVS